MGAKLSAGATIWIEQEISPDLDGEKLL